MSGTEVRTDYRKLMTQALRKLEAAESRLHELQMEKSEAIAVIGMGCRFPGGADTPDEYWNLLSAGRDATSEAPAGRLDIAGLYDPDPRAPGKMYTRSGGFLRQVDGFDPGFFGISNREASSIDPQQRLLLEVSWEALENAGLVPRQLAGGRAGVFVGLCSSDYSQLLAQRPRTEIDAYLATGNSHSVAAGRLAFLLGFTGPALAVDTACSSSLATVHVACQNLRQRECDLALAGGVNLMLTPDLTINFCKAQMLAPDGRCKTFDASADGFARGEGCGMVVLKRLSDAQRDGDTVLALIRGSALNQDGRTSGLTVPNGPAQQRVIRQALEAAHVDPADIGYVEAHGTGTPLGDPIEVGALGAVFGKSHSAADPLLIGSVKTNLGHLEGAAGVASLIKVVLSLRHGVIPRHLHFRRPSAEIDWQRLPVRVCAEATPWPEHRARRVAGISSFGFSGTNAHVVVEAAPPAPAADLPGRRREIGILNISARTPGSLTELARGYERFLAEHPALDLGDVCYSAAVRRTPFRHRLSVNGRTSDEVRAKLSTFLSGETAQDVEHGFREGRGPAPVAFLFTGQGSQYTGMGRGLYAAEPVFRAALDRCQQIVAGRLDRPLLEIMFAHGDLGRGDLDATLYTQPALFSLGYALAELWRSWGVLPAWVMGHSLGEYVAACVAGALDLEDGLRLVTERARLMQALPADGAMAAIFAGEQVVAEAIAGRERDNAGRERDISIAAVNGPANTVIAGRAAALDDILAELRQRNIDARRLTVSHAFHSPLMDPMLDAFAEEVDKIRFHPLSLPLVSNLTGEVLPAGARFDAHYWLRHTREPVRFQAGIRTLLGTGCQLFLEVGAKPVLGSMGLECGGGDQAWLPSLVPGRDDSETIHAALAALHVRGAPVEWSRYFEGTGHRFVPIPTYAFQRRPVWFQLDDATMETETISIDLEASPAASQATQPERRAASPAADRQVLVLRDLVALTAGLLRMPVEDMDIHAPFLEMGADSLVLMEAVRSAEKTFGVKISVRQIFETHTNVAALAAFIAETMPGEHWARLSGQAGQAAADPMPPPGRPEPAPTPVAPAWVALPPQSPALVSAVAPTAPASLADPSFAALCQQQLQVFEQIVSRQLAAFGGAGVGGAAAPATAGTTPDRADTPRAAVVGPVAREAIAPKPGISAAQSAPATVLPSWKAAEVRTHGLTLVQQEHLEALIARYTARTRGSKALTQRYRAVLADNRASAGFRYSTKEMLYPIVADRSQGSRIWDIDGNEYIDITMGFGSYLFGHNPPFIMQALRDQLDEGIQLGPQAALAGEVAQLVCDLTGLERAYFCNTGTEAVLTAIRLARNGTGRNRIAVFSGSYHGHSDGVLGEPTDGNADPRARPMVGGVTQGAVADVLVLKYGEPDSLRIIRDHAGELAAVLVEPVQSRRPDFRPKEFLLELRALTQETGIALIFDEMITGFRIHPGGAQAWYGIRADLATYGKIAGGGLPVGIVAGSARFMDAIDGGFWSYGDASYPRADMTFVAGTFNKNPLSTAAVHAVLAEIKRQGPALQDRLNQRTADLVARLNGVFDRDGAPIRVVHFGSLFRFTFTGNMDLFFFHLLDRGIYVWEGRNCILSDAHSDADIDAIVRAVEDSVRALRDGGYIDGGAHKQGGQPTAAASAATPDAKKNFWERERRVTRTSLTAVDADAGVDPVARSRGMEFSLYFFGIYDHRYDRDKYRLLFESARYADANGFTAIWVPERHFHEFGGLSPNPSVLCAALARETERIQLRAGSVVLPLHHPIRAAEEWSVVDNISGGRVGVAFASGWNPADFALAPDNFGNPREAMFAGIDQIRRLWAGEALTAAGGNGQDVAVRLFPAPMQAVLPTWLTIVNNPESFAKAGEMGVGILTNLMAQDVDLLAENLQVYRRKLAEHGHPPARGHVTLLMHTFIGSDFEAAIETARQPFKQYLTSSVGLFRNMAKSQGISVDFDALADDDKDVIFERAYRAYVKSTALIGTPESCAAVVDRLKAIGVDEIACLIDFGVAPASVLNSLPVLADLKNRHAPQDETEISVPLTEAQRQLVLLSRMNPQGSVAYNETVVLALDGKLRLDALRRAVQALVERHQALRSRINVQDNKLVIAPLLEIDIPLTEFSALPDGEQAPALESWFAARSDAAFDLEAGPLFKVELASLSAERHYLSVSAHHTVIDGASIGILLGELSALYNAEVSGAAPNLPEPAQIGDYGQWLSQSIESAEWQRQKAFWVDRMSSDAATLELPADHPRPPRKTYNGKRLTTTLDPRLRAAIKQIGQRENCTLFMTLLAAYTVLLHRMANQPEIVVGIAALGRSMPGSDDLVGYCAHIMPIRSNIAAGPRFTEHLRAIRSELLDAYENQDIPFANYLADVEIPRDPSWNPLVNYLFNLDGALPGLTLQDLTVAVHDQPVGTARFDIGFNAVEIADSLVLYCDYNTDLFEPATISRLLDGFQTLLDAIARAPDEPVFDLKLLSPVQREQILEGFNQPAHPVPAERPPAIHHAFESAAAAAPDAVAVILPATDAATRESLTYALLNQRANRLAHYLIERGVAAEDLVGIYLDRSIDMVVAVLAILKAGGAYLPLDPDYPQARIDFITADAGARFIVTKHALRREVAATDAAVICIDTVAAAIRGQPDHDPARPVSGDHLAYIIYTSGSTGKPKGTEITHRNVVRLFTATEAWFGFGPDDVWTLFHSLAFDFSVWELWGALAYGGRLVIVPYETSRTPSAFYALLAAERATVLNQTPSAFQQLSQYEGSREAIADLALRQVIFGGESLDPSMLKPWVERHGDQQPQLVNSYGITETTVLVSYRPMTAADIDGARSLIGRPIPDLRIYILDDRGNPVPIGVCGEIHVAGAGVARGYLRRPGLTHERFGTDPFGAGRLYKSGDLARYLPNGDIEYLGRRDHQVKLRGFRIELGEIEAALTGYPGIVQAVVLVADDPHGDKRLVAYMVTPAGEAAPSVAMLRAHLKTMLPDYMVPSAFVPLQALPLTAHGKIDRAALPAPELTAASGDDYVAPRTPTEEVLAEIWGEVLSVERVGVHDSFFDLGGHSLLATQLLTRIRQAFRMDVSIAQLFEAQTVADLAQRLIALEPTPGQVEKVAVLRRRIQAMSADEIASATARHDSATGPRRDVL
jgi:natural product biosynthesis luciferase-like monooxygenase protein/amino acid adenylation domain-containing protein